MKKIILFFVLLFSFSVLAGCTGSTANSSTNSSTPASTGKLSVVASFYPMYDFASKVGGDKVSVTNLTPAGTEPHDWEPSSADMIRLEKAQVFIYNGAGMEHWVDSVLSSLQNKNLVVVEASVKAPFLDSAGDSSGSTSVESSSVDPHVWLDPEIAKIEMKSILDAFQKADPTDADYFQANYDKYALEFDKLDAEFTAALADVPRKDIVVAHNAFGYLCNAYGLTQMPIEGLSADSEPDAARMSEIIDFVSKNNVKVIFFEELVSPKVAQAIAGETGSTTAVLNPLEGISEADQAAGKDYFSVMRENLKTLVKALS